jgi:hypothetical protein
MLSQLNQRVTGLQDELRTATGDITARIILLESKVLALENERVRCPCAHQEISHAHAHAHALLQVAPASGLGPPSSPRRLPPASSGLTGSTSAGGPAIAKPQYRISTLDTVFSQPVRPDREVRCSAVSRRPYARRLLTHSHPRLHQVDFRERGEGLRQLQESIAQLHASSVMPRGEDTQHHMGMDVHTPPHSPSPPRYSQQHSPRTPLHSPPSSHARFVPPSTSSPKHPGKGQRVFLATRENPMAAQQHATR